LFKMKKFSHAVLILILTLALALTGCGGGSGGGGRTNNGGGATVINIAAIPGVVVPVRGEVPVTTPIDTAQYTGSITWSPADNPFAPATVYTANIVLTAKTGYNLNGVAENFFTVAGATTVTNAANSGVVTAVFPETGAADDVKVDFLSATQISGASGTADSTGLTLTFSADPTTLTADNITVTGATKGDLSGSGTTRTLTISNITVLNGETVSVTITSPAGYSISGSPQTAVVYRAPINVTFLEAVQDGGYPGTSDSIGLILRFSADPTTLTADNITVTGATKGALSVVSGGYIGRLLTISDITVANGETVTITITNPPGYSITGSPQTAVVYRALSIGMEYLGGKIAYIFQYGDPGFNARVPHGLIAATADQSEGILWAVEACQSTSVPGGTGTALGTGSANTDNIIAQNGAGTTYAAGLARAYNGGGYSDWFLPSKDELNKLYLSKDAIGGFADVAYWSSSDEEIIPDVQGVWVQHFFSGSQNRTGKTINMLRVRAVRSF
jgi:hypothetical protein